jgi:hypothetical protein
MSLALLGSLRERKQSEVANIKSTSTGPKDGERLSLRDLFEGRLVVVDHIMHTKAGILRALPQMEGYSILFTNFRTSRIWAGDRKRLRRRTLSPGRKVELTTVVTD